MSGELVRWFTLISLISVAACTEDGTGSDESCGGPPVSSPPVAAGQYQTQDGAKSLDVSILDKVVVRRYTNADGKTVVERWSID